jgi:5'-nucleotidase
MMNPMRPFVCLALAASACTISVDAPNLAGQDVHLTVVHTADLHSRFFPYYFAPGAIDKGLGLTPKTDPQGHALDFAVVGGIGRVSTVVKCIRGIYQSDYPDGEGYTPTCAQIAPKIGPPAARSLHLDSGDIFEGAPVFNQFNGEVEMRAMSEIGLSAMALGNHEFDKGTVNLEEQYQKFGGFPILAANYHFADPTDPTQPKLADLIHDYQLFNVNGVKIGVIGLGNLSSIQGIIEGTNTLGVMPISAPQAIAQAVQLVRPQVDALFLISHLGLDEDEGVASGAAASSDQNLQLGDALNQVDNIFGGHLHIVLDPPKDLPHFDPTDGHLTSHTVLTHSGAFAKYVGRLDLVIHMASDQEKAMGIRSSVKTYTYRLVPIDDTIPSDPVMDNMLEPYAFKMNQFLNLSQVYAVIPCSTMVATCPKTLRNDPNGGDSQLGNLVATSMRLREGVEADFGLTNSLGIRADFESGPLNLEQMYNVFPFDNTITTMFLSGDETQQMLDFVAARTSERGCRTQAQVSGIYFDLVCVPNDMDCNMRQDMQHKPHGPCAKNIHLGDNCRLPDNTFNDTDPSMPHYCRPLDEFGEYRVAVNDYIAQGGSGFTVLKRNTTKFNTGISLRDSLVDYIRTLPTFAQDVQAADVMAGTRPAKCDPAGNTNIVGVTCSDPHGAQYDCTATCCDPNICHNSDYNPQADAMFQACLNAAAVRTAADGTPLPPLPPPQHYDYRQTACLDFDIQAHDGRIQTLSGGM